MIPMGGQLFLYCERGQSTALTAEPFNVASNLAYLLAAAAAAGALSRRPKGERLPSEAGLVALIAMIGAGSIVFHTFATRWAIVADVVPIAAFMLAYTGFAARRFLSLSWPATWLAIALLIAAMTAAAATPCAGGPCLNGSAGYLPALIFMIATGIAALKSSPPAGCHLLVASAILGVALALRTLDRELCDKIHLFGSPRGTHALWHLLTAIMLAVLMRAALTHRPAAAQN